MTTRVLTMAMAAGAAILATAAWAQGPDRRGPPNFGPQGPDPRFQAPMSPRMQGPQAAPWMAPRAPWMQQNQRFAQPVPAQGWNRGGPGWGGQPPAMGRRSGRGMQSAMPFGNPGFGPNAMAPRGAQGMQGCPCECPRCHFKFQAGGMRGAPQVSMRGRESGRPGMNDRPMERHGSRHGRPEAGEGGHDRDAGRGHEAMREGRGGCPGMGVRGGGCAMKAGRERSGGCSMKGGGEKAGGCGSCPMAGRCSMKKSADASPEPRDRVAHRDGKPAPEAMSGGCGGCSKGKGDAQGGGCGMGGDAKAPAPDVAESAPDRHDREAGKSRQRDGRERDARTREPRERKDRV